MSSGAGGSTPKLRIQLANFGDTFVQLTKTTVRCNVCNANLQNPSNYDLTRHIHTKKHIDAHERPAAATFYREICEAFVAANIPLYKLQNPVFKTFMEKYTNRHVPDESTLRKLHLPQCASKVLGKIRAHIGDNYMWVSADETMYSAGRCIVNVVVGILHPTTSYTPLLIKCHVSDTVNADIISSVISESLQNIFDGQQEKANKVLLLVSDAAPYMIQAGKVLKDRYRNMLHITCIAHALHHICEFIRDHFEDVDTLINMCRKIFLKVPQRVSLYRELCPHLALPPAPVATRWGTWLQACVFYFTHFEDIKTIVSTLKDDSRSITQCKRLLQKSTLLQQLQYIHNNFKTLPDIITFFECQNVSLTEAMTTLQSIRTTLENIPGDFGVQLRGKIRGIFRKNPDLHILLQLGLHSLGSDVDPQYAQFIDYFHHPPLSSVDVERTFSAFKDLLASKRHSLMKGNLETLLLVYANQSLLL